MVTDDRIIIKGIKIFFVFLFIISIVSKILYPVPFYSFTISIFKYSGIGFIYSYIPSNVIAILLLSLVIFIEVSIIYVFFKDVSRAFIYVFLFLNTSLIILSVSYILGIPIDCGCFGKIIVFDNDLYHLFFLSVLLILSAVPIVKKANYSTSVST